MKKASFKEAFCGMDPDAAVGTTSGVTELVLCLVDQIYNKIPSPFFQLFFPYNSFTSCVEKFGMNKFPRSFSFGVSGQIGVMSSDAVPQVTGLPDIEFTLRVLQYINEVPGSCDHV